MASRLTELLSSRAVKASRLDQRVRLPLLAVAGLACGSSPFFLGYFDMSVWGPIAIGLIVVTIGILIAKPVLPKRITIVAVLGLLGFAAWCLLSMSWAESADRALTEGDRWILYGVYFLLLASLIEERRDGEVFLGSAVVGVLAVAGCDLVKMLTGQGPELFGESRLLEPLGYINGMGGLFLLGFWPLAAVAERVRSPILAGLSAAVSSVLVSLVVMTASRGTAFAFGISAILALVLLPGRRRRAWLLVFVFAGLAVAWGPLNDVTAALPAGHSAPGAEVTKRGAQWALLIGAFVGAPWGAAQWIRASLSLRSSAQKTTAAVSTAGLAAIATATVVVILAAVGNPFTAISEQYDSFTNLNPVTTSTRFTSGGGNRYDYWRIAWKQFTDHPLEGVGAGNFDRTYFLERRTNEDVRQAHSIEMGPLGETGLIGALLLATFFTAVFIGVFRRSRAAIRGSEIGLTVAAVGTFFVWLGQTSVDWLHLIPGLTGIALGVAAILLAPAGAHAEDSTETRTLRSISIFAVVVAVALSAVAIVFIGRPVLAEHLRTEAQAAVSSEPRVALEKASEALSLNSDSVQGYYLEAAAWARLHSYRQARQALREAISREPHNYVSWALLGDLTTRRGDIAQAMKAYGKASALNPRDKGLKALASNRQLLERLHRQPEAPALLPESET